MSDNDDRQGQADVAPGRVSFTKVFIRFVICAVGYLIAVIAAGLVGTLGLFQGLEGDAGYLAFVAGTVFFGVFAIASSAFVPFLFVAVLTELFQARSVVLFACLGALIGLYAAFTVIDWQATTGFSDRRLHVAAAAGIAGGVIYWMVAGRRAGDVRERRYTSVAAAHPNR